MRYPWCGEFGDVSGSLGWELFRLRGEKGVGLWSKLDQSFQIWSEQRDRLVSDTLRFRTNPSTRDNGPNTSPPKKWQPLQPWLPSGKDLKHPNVVRFVRDNDEFLFQNYKPDCINCINHWSQFPGTIVQSDPLPVKTDSGHKHAGALRCSRGFNESTCTVAVKHDHEKSPDS